MSAGHGLGAVPPTSLATGEGDHAQHGGGGEYNRSALHSPPLPPSAVPLPRVAGEERSVARLFRRGPWENVAVVLIGLGIVMLMQPYVMALFTWSFVTILVGTAMFVIVSHFPE
jgi:hypothetical protein